MIKNTATLPLHLSEVATPGLMLSNAWPVSRETEGATEAAIHEALRETDFFEALQIVDVPYPEERKRIAAFLAESNIPMTYTLTRYLAKAGVSLGDPDPEVRRRGCTEAIAKVREAAELGATTVGFVSGARAEDPALRPAALEALGESLTAIARAAAEIGGVTVIVEPLDVDAHKKFILGTAEEAVDLCRSAHEQGAPLKLCLDTAHMVLNGEDVPDAVRIADGFVDEFHFCNCVLDKAHPEFGDRHLPFGPPGEVDTQVIGEWMAELYAMGFFGAERPKVFCEVLPHHGMTSIDVVRHCRQSLEAGWAIARRILSEDD